jgi:PilZ domain
MTVVEQRRHHRYPLVRQAAGEFRLLTPAGAYPIDVIKDISSSGIRVYLNTYLAERLPISVEYADPTIKLELNGMVAWCVAQEQESEAIETFGRYIVGIQLFSPVLLMAMSGLY